jgi:L-lactate dehydrogenase complex protein LldG
MDGSLSRQKILDSIRKTAGQRNVDLHETDFENSEIYKPILPDPLICFQNELEAIQGKCLTFDNELHLFAELKTLLESRNLLPVYCRDSKIAALLDKYQIPHTNNSADFEKMSSAITPCESLIARTGSVVVSSNGESGRQLHAFPPIHIVLANISQLVNYPNEAYNAIQSKYKNKLPSAITTITGPSRTADIEKTLVLGAHGPKELIVFILT